MLHFWWGNWGPALSNLFKFTQLVKKWIKLRIIFLLYTNDSHILCIRISTLYQPISAFKQPSTVFLRYGQSLRTYFTSWWFSLPWWHLLCGYLLRLKALNRSHSLYLRMLGPKSAQLCTAASRPLLHSLSSVSLRAMIFIYTEFYFCHQHHPQTSPATVFVSVWII